MITGLLQRLRRRQEEQRLHDATHCWNCDSELLDPSFGAFCRAECADEWHATDPWP